MKRIALCFVFALVLAALLIGVTSCGPHEDKYEGKEIQWCVDKEDFKPEAGTLYKAFLYIREFNENGFSAGGTLHDVKVNYPGASNKFKLFYTVRVVFDGKDIVGEKYEINGITYIKWTISEVKSIRLANPDKGEPLYDKPIIYLYPEEDTVCSVRLELDGELTCTYPKYGENGWENFTASANGTLTFPDGREYYALYWEGRGKADFDLSEGFCVKGEDTAEFLADILPKLGLTPREANEFIVYWLPLMQDNEYNLITFQKEAYEEDAKLIVEPTPDTVIRVFMAYKALGDKVEIAAPEIVTPERTGFTVVEWGGTEIK